MASADIGLPFQIGIASRSASVSLDDIVKVTAALNLQISRDFAPIWGVSASIVAVPNPDAIDPGIWPIFVQDDTGADAAGFHLTRHNQPYALVESGPTWSLTASHECLELLADPTGNRVYPSVAIVVGTDGQDFADQGQTKLEYLVEVCDPCEDESCAYLINDILVSDFYTPRYFDPTGLASVRYSFSGKITRPRQVLKNGYLSWLDPLGGGFRQAKNFNGPEIIRILVPPDIAGAGLPLRGLLDRLSQRPQQSNLNPKDPLSLKQDQRQNWLGIAAVRRAAQYQVMPSRLPNAADALFGAAAAAPAESHGPSAADIAKLIEDNRDKLNVLGVMSARPGRKLVDGWPQPERAIVVISEPDQGEGVRARLNSLFPDGIGGVPLDIREASPLQNFRRANPQAYAAVASGPREEYELPDFPGEIHFGPADQEQTPEAQAAALMGAARTRRARVPLDYTRPAGVSLEPVEEDMTLDLHASPDAGWQLLKPFLTKGPGDLVVGMYDFTAPHINEAIDSEGGKLTLTLDHPPGKATREQTIEDTEANLQNAFKERLSFAWALEGHNKMVTDFIYPNAYHIKVAVRPDDVMWLSSGNWNTTNQPEIDLTDRDAAIATAKQSDRDWHIIAHSPGLSKVFRAYLLEDSRVALQHQADAALAAVAAAAPDEVPDALLAVEARPKSTVTFFDPHSVTGRLKVQPLLTPKDYQPHILDLIKSAETSFWMQTQYIKYSGKQGDEDHDALIAAVAKLIANGRDVRLITSEFESADMIELLMDQGIDSRVLRIQPHVHNKGIIVDHKTVVVSSQNWSADGTLRNRDAGLIIYDCAEAARYFEQIFLHDWAHLASQSTT